MPSSALPSALKINKLENKPLSSLFLNVKNQVDSEQNKSARIKTVVFILLALHPFSGGSGSCLVWRNNTWQTFPSLNQGRIAFAMNTYQDTIVASGGVNVTRVG